MLRGREDTENHFPASGSTEIWSQLTHLWPIYPPGGKKIILLSSNVKWAQMRVPLPLKAKKHLQQTFIPGAQCLPLCYLTHLSSLHPFPQPLMRAQHMLSFHSSPLSANCSQRTLCEYQCAGMGMRGNAGKGTDTGGKDNWLQGGRNPGETGYRLGPALPSLSFSIYFPPSYSSPSNTIYNRWQWFLLVCLPLTTSSSPRTGILVSFVYFWVPRA